jgi:RHS repeat-associated protein
MTAGGVRYYLVYDQVGTLRAVTDGSGAIVKRIDYDSFGNVIADSNLGFTVPFGFAGGLHDRDTGLVRFGYRDYDPATGRWTAKDPIDFAGGDTDLFGYVQNDPINFIDPYGLKWVLGVGGGLIGLDVSWNSSNPNVTSYSTGTGVLAAGALSVGWQGKEGIFGPTVHEIVTKTPINVGIFGKYGGISVNPDLSGIMINLGYGMALPLSMSVPLGETGGAIGEWLYDVLHPEQTTRPEPKRYKVPKQTDDPC